VKGEKYPCEGSEIVPETACLQAVVKRKIKKRIKEK